MKLNIRDAPGRVREGHGIEPGNVYQNQRGQLYIVVNVFERDSLSGAKIIALVVDKDTGEVTNAVSYGQGYFAQRTLLGMAINLPSEIEIDWVI